MFKLNGKTFNYDLAQSTRFPRIKMNRSITQYLTEVKKPKEHLNRELFAKLAHKQWSGWMTYLFSKSQMNSDGSCTIPQWAVKRWTLQLNTEYANLSHDEKESDRKEADKFILLTKKS